MNAPNGTDATTSDGPSPIDASGQSSSGNVARYDDDAPADTSTSPSAAGTAGDRDMSAYVVAYEPATASSDSVTATSPERPFTSAAKPFTSATTTSPATTTA